MGGKAERSSPTKRSRRLLGGAGRRPWSTVRTVPRPSGIACAVSQSAARCISATESPPPDTASAKGAFSGEPSSSRAAANRARDQLRRQPHIASRRSLRGARRDRGTGLRIFRRERGKGGTAFIHLAQLRTGQAELEHAVRRARRRRISLQQLGEIARRVCVILLRRIGDVAGPIQRGGARSSAGWVSANLRKASARVVILGARRADSSRHRSRAWDQARRGGERRARRNLPEHARRRGRCRSTGHAGCIGSRRDGRKLVARRGACQPALARWLAWNSICFCIRSVCWAS